MTDEINDGSIRILAGLLETRTGQQLAMSRRWRIDTALRPLLEEEGAATLDELAARVVSGRQPALADRVVEALLNHETFFYRDMQAFEQLEAQGLERLREARGGDRRLRLWSAGCATGQETYTLAMIFAQRPDRWRGWTIEILGTDLSNAAVARARDGIYTQFEIQRGLPITQMLNRFRPVGDNWQADPTLRSMVRFQVHNLLDPPPPGGFDVVLCRNVLLYFAQDVRRLVFARLAGAVREDGLLMLGAGETAMGQTDHFVSDYACRSLYRPRVGPPATLARRA